MYHSSDEYISAIQSERRREAAEYRRARIAKAARQSKRRRWMLRLGYPSRRNAYGR